MKNHVPYHGEMIKDTFKRVKCSENFLKNQCTRKFKTFIKTSIYNDDS